MNFLRLFILGLLGGSVDATAPALVGNPTINAAGTEITFTFSEALDTGSTPAAGDFALGGTARTITSLLVSGSTVVGTLSGVIGTGVAVTATYTAGGAPIQDLAGNDAANLVAQAVTNNSTQDVTAPTFVSAVINAAGTLLTLTYTDASGALDAASVPTLTIGGTRLSVLAGAASVVGLTVTRAFDRPVASDETGITVTTSGSPVRDAAGNNAAALVGQAVTNSSTVLAPLAVYGADLHQWFRGDNVTLNGGNVSTWQDLSGKGNDGIQGGATAQPAYTAIDATLNNQPTAAGDGANDVLITAGLTVDLTTEDVYFCTVFKQITWTLSDVLSGGNAGNVARFAQGATSPQMRLNASSAGVGTENAGAPLGAWVRGEGMWTGTSGGSYLRLGSAAASFASGSLSNGARVSSSLFGNPSSLWGNHAVAEFLMVKRPAGSGGPTAQQRAAIDAYLQARYPSASF